MSFGYQRSFWEFTTRGFLVTEWQAAIAHYTPDKPEEKMKHIIRGLWTILFSSIWDKRNEIGHKPDNVVTKYERKQQCIHTLQEWKTNELPRLGHSQSFMIQYTQDEITQWTLSTMKHRIRLLRQASCSRFGVHRAWVWW